MTPDTNLCCLYYMGANACVLRKL